MGEVGLRISPEELALVRAVLRRHVPGREVWAFGSRVVGPMKPHSDLDLAILGDEPLELVVAGRLRDAFAESDLPFRVDIVDWALIAESFRDVIRNHRVVLQEASSPWPGS